MAWELAPGKIAQPAFCISPEGNAELRQTALRWLASAPPARRDLGVPRIEAGRSQAHGPHVGTWRFDLEETRAITSWDATRRRLDVRLYTDDLRKRPRTSGCR